MDEIKQAGRPKPPPEPARSDGYVPNWVMTTEQFRHLSEEQKRRWCWETYGGITTGRQRNLDY